MCCIGLSPSKLITIFNISMLNNKIGEENDLKLYIFNYTVAIL